MTSSVPTVTFAVIVFKPLARVIDPVADPVPVLMVVAPFFSNTVAAASAAVAVPVCGLDEVVAVYHNQSGSNVGLNVSEPIANAERLATKGLV